MLVPSIFNDNFVDDFFDGMFDFPTMRKAAGMNVDVKEYDQGYEMELELPGYDKEDIKADLKDGYLTITAKHEENKDEKDNGKYIRKERFYGQCQRSFFVGEGITENDIHANFKNGILTLNIPKKEVQPEVEQKHYIPIEG